MPALRSLLPRLGLFLCLALHLSPSLSASDNGSCVVIDQIITSDSLEINTTANLSGGDVTYTVKVPVNNSVSAVILKAVKEDGSPVGTWDGAYETCNTSSVYNLTSLSQPVFQTTWTVPASEDVTKVNLQVLVLVNRTALESFVKVEQVKSSASTPIPESSENSLATITTPAVNTANTTAVNTANTTAVTTAKTTAVTTAKTTAKSLAIRTLDSPLAGALHILIVFLISKLLF
ncbi:placenta-expressed transcript 1 protein [Mus pahari]|uniref:placenta-expressed transcript 1 protein n=1 Tax=Mus pahari TaxID=10093 RepID=UPI000A31131A|nr:placenta-expressed transcript 1 protein [Mus pahari]